MVGRLDLREEVTSGAGQIDDVQMSLFNAIKGTVPYSKAAYYGEITHPTADLVDLMGKIAVRLGVDGQGSEQAQGCLATRSGHGWRQEPRSGRHVAPRRRTPPSSCGPRSDRRQWSLPGLSLAPGGRR